MLSLTAIVIANLCVSYIMVNKNEEAEEIMKRLEAEEEKAAEIAETEKQANQYHLCIVNLVIGTLYCSKNNYDFGVGRIIKSLEPIQKKVSLFLFSSIPTHGSMQRDAYFPFCKSSPSTCLLSKILH